MESGQQIIHDMLYDVPYKAKDGAEVRQEEYALLLATGGILITKYMEDGIRSAFTQDKKGEIQDRTKVIFDNNIQFLNAHRIKFPYYYYIDASNGGVINEIFGKLDEDYTHTIITRQADSYRTETSKFDEQHSDRSFFSRRIGTRNF